MNELIILNARSYVYATALSRINNKSTSKLINRAESIGHQTMRSLLKHKIISNIPNRKNIHGSDYSVISFKVFTQ